MNSSTSYIQTLPDQQLKRLMKNLKPRLGLVPNYFIYRGEDIPPEETFYSASNVLRRATQKVFMLFQRKDFRDEKSFAKFDSLMKALQSTARQDEAGTQAVRDLINSSFDKEGNTLLQKLIITRHLRFTKSLLLHCGEYIDFNARNKNNFSAFQLASDRLETETVYLLLLYGVHDDRDAEIHSASDATAPPFHTSLSSSEFWKIDIFGNLDTGRWLNRKTVEATMEHAKCVGIPEEELMKWTAPPVTGDDSSTSTAFLSDDCIFKLGQVPQIFSITLADGCDAITNHEAWAGTIRHLLRLREAQEKEIRVSTPKEQKLLFQHSHKNAKTPLVAKCDDFYGYLRGKNVDVSSQRAAGRTLFYTCYDDSEIAVKISKRSETERAINPLIKEALMNRDIDHLKNRYGLKSDYPTDCELLMISELPQDIQHTIENQLSGGFHSTEGVGASKDTKGTMALVYRPPKGYGRYINDASLSLEDFHAGINKAIYDFAVLARHGLYHGALVDIQHDASREARPHLWSFESFLTRFRSGSGRIDGGFSGFQHPNVRASGLADLKHLLTKEQVNERFDPSHIHSQHNILYDDQERLLVALNEQLGSGLFGVSLLVGSSWERRHSNGAIPQDNVDLPKALKGAFCSFLSGYLQVGDVRASELLSLMGSNFVRMADQIEMFSTPSYVAIAETAPRRPIFGCFAKTLGWISHPTAFAHFCQRAGTPLDKKAGYSLEGIAKVYTSGNSSRSTLQEAPVVLPDGFPRVDTSMMRCSPRWVQKKGWINKDGKIDFGPYEGVLPFQQLIRDLYAVTYMATMLRNEQ
eukprot:CAMPEP_0195308562 /NCGR_PEP_ID=MMETSP0707-20130614/38287_1 /TAXON_ID=33640 /ORGANISM="Asterionellopsis glacialis, Strain CCMP134" /LENGTH=807 /DNA_ID=CAMNT_0040372835 /DNA_START=185 /DNA_END=2608 /DNA_ORIENTATION=+